MSMNKWSNRLLADWMNFIVHKFWKLCVTVNCVWVCVYKCAVHSHVYLYVLFVMLPCYLCMYA